MSIVMWLIGGSAILALLGWKLKERHDRGEGKETLLTELFRTLTGQFPLKYEESMGQIVGSLMFARFPIPRGNASKILISYRLDPMWHVEISVNSRGRQMESWVYQIVSNDAGGASEVAVSEKGRKAIHKYFLTYARTYAQSRAR